jgi:hypothetical protein|tara:strand:- start:839 stop:1318 length:480 start_codon:yes stop_codon:yes gene_type:complete
MTILATQLKLFRSTNGLGGAITATEIVSNSLHNLFDIVSPTEARDGDTEYRCCYIKNMNTTLTLQDATVQIISDTPSTGTVMGIGLDTAAIGTSGQTITDESTAPIGVTFSQVLNNELAIGNIPPNSFKAFWVRRVITAGVAASASDPCTLRVLGATTA